MRERTYFKPSNNTVETLIEDLDLPPNVKLPKDLIVAKIFEMKDKEYSTILIERYLNGRTYTKIEELHPELYFSCFWSACRTALKRLRSDVIEEYVGIDSFPIGKYMGNTRLSAHGYLSRSVKDTVKLISGMNYRPSKDHDRIILTLQKLGFILDYPKFLLRYPPYPYNLYSHIVQNDGIMPSFTALEIRRKYMNELIMFPTHNVYVFEENVGIIFDDDCDLLTWRQKEVTSLYYIEYVRIPEISKHLSISESLIKYELRKVVSILNSEEGKSLIYNINR